MTRYLQSLSSLVDLERLPEGLDLIQDLTADLLADVYFDHLRVEPNAHQDGRTYTLDVVLGKRLGLGIPGTGAALLLNPDDDQGTTFHATFAYSWPILRYVNGFDLESFSFLPADTIALFQRIFSLADESLVAGVAKLLGGPSRRGPTELSLPGWVDLLNALYLLEGTPQELSAAAITTFAQLEAALAAAGIPIAQFIADFRVDTDYPGGSVTIEEVFAGQRVLLATGPLPIAELIARLNDDFALTGTPQEVPYQASPETTYEEVAAALVLAGVTVDQLVAKYVLEGLSDFDELLDALTEFFSIASGQLEIAALRDLFVPSLALAVDGVRLALEFPESLLQPLDATGQPIPGETSKLYFDVGRVSWDSITGFEIEGTSNLSFPKSQILRSGLTLEILDAKLDLSRTSNIPEAVADQRPEDFVGAYVRQATIGFPAFWQHDGAASTAEVVANNLLIGTGGLTGTLTLAAKAAGVPQPVVALKLGDGFRISLDKFLLAFRQNAITQSVIEGTLVIPGFKDANDDDAEIRIRVAIRQDGDFDVTAHEDQGFAPIRFPGVFEVGLRSVFVGRQGDDFYLGVSGAITFTHPLLANLVKDPIEVEKLVIWSDGRFEIEGGTIPLPTSLRFPIGPAEISITAIHLGSHQDAGGTKFRYFGFDGALDVNPGGVDVRGKGIKFYFPADGTDLSRCFLEIKSLAIDLVIPGSASKETATLLVSGFLSVGGSGGDPEYAGGVAFSLPKVKIAGGAAMTYRPKVPAFLVDAFVELSVPIPFGATSLGIFGFRGLFGLRYIATKTAAGLSENDTWFDYYKAPVEEGVNIDKFELPGQTAGYDSTLSIGAGVSLATVSDGGKAFSSKLFLLLSLPDLIYLEGKANIVGERVGLTGDDPPFFAVLALTPQSVELGAGVRYQLPREGVNKGQILDLNAEMRAAFFFKNSAAWYVNVGTIQNPTTARILSLFDATSYLMLSAAGIAAGAGVTFGFNKSYAGGLVRASVGAYIRVGGFISFERPQIGGFAMLGGHVDVSFMWLSLYIVLDTSLSVEAAQPFYVQGSVHLCVGVTIGFWKFKKTISRCFDVEFIWVKDTTVDISPVLPLSTNAALPPASAASMLAGETFKVAAFGEAMPAASDEQLDATVLPLDTWVDLEFLKGLLPAPSVDARIGRLSGQAPAKATELIPPAEVPHRVAHRYSLRALEIRAWSGSSWVDYRPYAAMSPPAALAVLAADPQSYKDGFWTNTGDGFNKLRLLAETSLSYMQGGGYVPEEMGITAASLFCRGTSRDERCLRWTELAAGTAYSADQWAQGAAALYRIRGGAGTVVAFAGIGGTANALAFANRQVAEIVLPKACASVRLRLTTFAASVVVRFYQRQTVGTGSGYALVDTRTLTQLQLLAPIEYEQPSAPVARIEIEPAHADQAGIDALLLHIRELYRTVYLSSDEEGEHILRQIRQLEFELERRRQRECHAAGLSPDDFPAQIAELEGKLARCRQDLAKLLAEQRRACRDAANFRTRFERCFPHPPARLSYDLPVATDPAGMTGFRWILYDDESEAVLRTSAGIYATAAAAEQALFAALPAIVGAQPPPVSREDGRRPCPPLGDLECWEQLWSTGVFGGIASPHELLGGLYGHLQRQLYARGRAHLDQLIRQCDELGGEVADQRAKCRALALQLAALEAALQASAGGLLLVPPAGHDCSTLIHEVCWLSREDYEFNLSLPGQAAVAGDYAATVAAIEKRLTPIWRPSTRYAIRLEVEDTVTPPGGADVATSRSFYFGFRTAGPLGHFHYDPHADYVKSGKPDEYLLTGLKGYIDYRRSYPNADGELIGAKPLFYEDARILLFFTKRYVYHFFGDWPAYNGLPALTGGAMQVVILDPAEKIGAQNPPPPHATTTEVPLAVLDWPRDDDPRIPEDVRALLHLRHPKLLDPDFATATCWPSGGQMIKPASVYTRVEPQHLRPVKLYTAIVNNVYQGAVREVHRYGFRTSRYPDFKAQVNSYRLEDEEGNARDAVFRLELPLTPADVQLMYDVVSGNLSAPNAALAGQWADPFDRLVEAVLMRQRPPLDAAIGTEFTMVRSASQSVVAVWVRNPEPFNDPKLPNDVLATSLRVVQGGAVNPAYRVLFSKDRAQAFIMHSSKSIPVPKLKLRFAYLEWNGVTYVEHDVVTTSFIPSGV